MMAVPPPRKPQTEQGAKKESTARLEQLCKGGDQVACRELEARKNRVEKMSDLLSKAEGA